MSGGVDSSAAAHLILSKGYEAIGATMTVTCGLPGNGDGNEEAEMARQKGLLLTGLGARILRCETAPLFVLSCLSFYYELGI